MGNGCSGCDCGDQKTEVEYQDYRQNILQNAKIEN